MVNRFGFGAVSRLALFVLRFSASVSPSRSTRFGGHPPFKAVAHSAEQATQSIAGYAGVVGVLPLPGRTAFEIEYDPAKLTEGELRRIAEENVPGLTLQKRTLRLDGAACEACAIRLEKKAARASRRVGEG